jgi:hypothetical protein
MLVTGAWLAGGCAAAVSVQARCQQGDPDGCVQYAEQMARDGDLKSAENAYQKACRADPGWGCERLGQFYVVQNRPANAEQPFRSACDQEQVTACRNLAGLRRQAGEPDGTAEAEALEERALLIEMPLAELILWGRPASPTHGIIGVGVSFQPLLLLRRFHFGAVWAMDLDQRWELSGFAGYQHFFGYIAPYVMALAGMRTGPDDPPRYDLGGELGVKLYPGTNVIHFNLAVGSSLGSPIHGSLGIGFDLSEPGFWQALMLPLLFCRR